jgi:hypothetical protein
MRNVIVLAMLCIANLVQAETPGCGKVKPTAGNTGTFSAGNLTGKHLGDLYAAYTGIRGIVPEKITVDPSRQLDSLWLAKIACHHVAPVVKKLHSGLIADYRAGHTYVTPDQFIAVADEEVLFVQKQMDWDRLAVLYKNCQ